MATSSGPRREVNNPVEDGAELAPASVGAVDRARPRGDRIPRVELDARLSLVEDLMTSGFPTRKIQDELERQKKWPRSTVARYIQQVRHRWMAEREAERPTDVEASIARLAMLSHKAEREKAWAAVARFESLLAEIRGVRAPEKHDHRVAVAHVPPPTAPRYDLLEALPDDVIDALERAADGRIARPAQLTAHVDG